VLSVEGEPAEPPVETPPAPKFHSMEDFLLEQSQDGTLRSLLGVRQFLGLAGYYRRFIPNFAELTIPLTDLTRKGASDPVQWTEHC